MLDQNRSDAALILVPNVLGLGGHTYLLSYLPRSYRPPCAPFNVQLETYYIDNKFRVPGLGKREKAKTYSDVQKNLLQTNL